MPLDKPPVADPPEKGGEGEGRPAGVQEWAARSSGEAPWEAAVGWELGTPSPPTLPRGPLGAWDTSLGVTQTRCSRSRRERAPPRRSAPYLEGCPETRSRGPPWGPLRVRRPAPRLSRAAASTTTLVLCTPFFFFFPRKPHFKNDKERVLLIFFCLFFSTTTLSL